eukprot:5297290-Amphidinium_carterae.1
MFKVNASLFYYGSHVTLKIPQIQTDANGEDALTRNTTRNCFSLKVQEAQRSYVTMICKVKNKTYATNSNSN